MSLNINDNVSTAPVFLTPAQLARRWQVSQMTLRRWRRAGKLAVYYIGRGARYRMDDVLRLEAEWRK